MRNFLTLEDCKREASKQLKHELCRINYYISQLIISSLKIEKHYLFFTTTLDSNGKYVYVCNISDNDSVRYTILEEQFIKLLKDTGIEKIDVSNVSDCAEITREHLIKIEF